MNKALFPIAVALLLCAATTRAQEASPRPFADNFNIGGNLTVYPKKNIDLFVGGGYALAGFAYNAGIKLRLLPIAFPIGYRVAID